MSHLGYAELQKFCSVLWLSLGWTKHSWDHMTDFLLNEKLISSEGSINKCWLDFLRVYPGPVGGTTGTQNWNGWLAPTAAFPDLQFNSIKDGAGCWAAFERVRGFRSSRREMEAGYKQEKSQHYSSSFQSERSAPGAGERARLWLNYQQDQKNKQALDGWHPYHLAGIHVTQTGGSSSLQSKPLCLGYWKQLFPLVSTPLFYSLQSTTAFHVTAKDRASVLYQSMRDCWFLRCRGLQRPAETQKYILKCARRPLWLTPLLLIPREDEVLV